MKRAIYILTGLALLVGNVAWAAHSILSYDKQRARMIKELEEKLNLK